MSSGGQQSRRSVGPYLAVAVDFDGTIAEEGRPSAGLLDAVAATRAEGRKVILVTGRILDELRSVFPDVDSHFDAIVAENGAVVAVGDAERLVAPPFEVELEDALRRRGLSFRRGLVLLADGAAEDHVVLEEIHRLALECQLMRNRGSLMVLPPGVTKGRGLSEALGSWASPTARPSGWATPRTTTPCCRSASSGSPWATPLTASRATPTSCSRARTARR
ncbi:MAG TPA: HAD hydrolase family protein [Acidimicrobiales bacterium]|nr:HAD hydrolase family protein [Acidimicrobiales bacterium]